jgi:cell division protein ZapA
MNGSADSVRVYIFGDEYPIKGNVDIEVTRKVADYVDRKMMEFQKNMASRDKLKVAVLSSINIAGELFELRESTESQSRQLKELQEKIGLLEKKIDTCFR